LDCICDLELHLAKTRGKEARALCSRRDILAGEEGAESLEEPACIRGRNVAAVLLGMLLSTAAGHEDVKAKLGVESRCAAPIAAIDVSPGPLFVVNAVQYLTRGLFDVRIQDFETCIRGNVRASLFN
jgi:hypothetical protein